MARLTFAVALLLGSLSDSLRADDWPQWLGPRRDGVWRETGLLAKFPQGGPKVLWRVPIENGFSGPAVADGRVYVTDHQRARDEKGNPLPPAKVGEIATRSIWNMARALDSNSTNTRAEPSCMQSVRRCTITLTTASGSVFK